MSAWIRMNFIVGISLMIAPISAEAKTKTKVEDCAPETLNKNIVKVVDDAKRALEMREELKSPQNFIRLKANPTCVEVSRSRFKPDQFTWATLSGGHPTNDREKNRRAIEGIPLDTEKNVDDRYINRIDLVLKGSESAPHLLDGNKDIATLFPSDNRSSFIGHFVMVQRAPDERASYPVLINEEWKRFASFSSITFMIGSPDKGSEVREVGCEKIPTTTATAFRLEEFNPQPGKCYWLDGTSKVIVKNADGVDEQLPLCW